MSVRNTLAVCVAAVLAATCGGKDKPPVLSEAEPAWVDDYKRIADAGCDCIDEDCLRDAHAKAEAMERAHGGLDDAPPSVQEAHGALDRCWRDGTDDLPRDLGDAVDAVCKCTDNECINSYRIAQLHIQDKYRVNLASPDDLDPASRETVARASVCINKVTVHAEEYLAGHQRRADAICRCDTRHCAEVSDRLDFGGRFYVPELQTIQVDVEIASDRYCQCLGGIIAKELKAESPDGKAPPPPTVDISLDPLIKCPPP